MHSGRADGRGRAQEHREALAEVVVLEQPRRLVQEPVQQRLAVLGLVQLLDLSKSAPRSGVEVREKGWLTYSTDTA